MEIPPPLVLKRPLFVPIKTLMGPGPSNCSQRVLSALSNPVIGHLHSECLQVTVIIENESITIFLLLFFR